MPSDSMSSSGDGLPLLCQFSELEEDEPMQVFLEGRAPLAVYLHEGEVFVTDDICTHGQAHLSEGYLEDGEIECPLHSGRFDIRTGQPTGQPCTEAITAYRTVVDGDAVYLGAAVD